MATRTTTTWQTHAANAVAGFAATLCLALTLWLAYSDKAAAATVTGVMTFAFVALRFLPLIESFEIFGLKGQLRKTISEADEALAALKGVTKSLGRTAYFQAAFQGRMTSPTWDQKLAGLAQVEAELTKLRLSEAELVEIRQPLLLFAAADIYALFRAVVIQRMNEERWRESIRVDAARKVGSEPSLERLHGLTDPPEVLSSVVRDDRLRNVRAFMQSALLQSGLDATDTSTLAALADRLGQVGDDMWRRGMITPEVLLIIRDDIWEKSMSTLFRETFGRDPKGHQDIRDEEDSRVE